MLIILPYRHELEQTQILRHKGKYFLPDIMDIPKWIYLHLFLKLNRKDRFLFHQEYKNYLFLYSPGAPILSDAEIVSTLPKIVVPFLYFFPLISKSCCAIKGIVEPSKFHLLILNVAAIFI